MKIRFFFFILSWNISPNDRMFSNASEVSKMIFSSLQKPFCVIWSWSKNYLPVWMCQGNFGQGLGFPSHPKLFLPRWLQTKFRGHEIAVFSLEVYKFQSTFCLCNEISRDLFINCKVNILVVIRENSTSKIRRCTSQEKTLKIGYSEFQSLIYQWNGYL